MQPAHLRQVADVVEQVKGKLLEMLAVVCKKPCLHIENPNDVGTSRLRT